MSFDLFGHYLRVMNDFIFLKYYDVLINGIRSTNIWYSEDVIFGSILGKVVNISAETFC